MTETQERTGVQALADSSFAYGFDDERVWAADPSFADAYERMVKGTTKPDVLAPRTQELIGLAANAAGTHLNREAVVAHVRGAKRAGATHKEILETLQIAACLGIHTVTFGGLFVREESSDCALAIAAPLDERRAALKQRWVDQREGWLPGLDAPLSGDPDFFDGASDVQNIPVVSGALEPKVRELLYVAIDGSMTHMHWGTKVHIRAALAHGATFEEVLATLGIASLIGVQGYAWGIQELNAEE